MGQADADDSLEEFHVMEVLRIHYYARHEPRSATVLRPMVDPVTECLPITLAQTPIQPCRSKAMYNYNLMHPTKGGMCLTRAVDAILAC